MKGIVTYHHKPRPKGKLRDVEILNRIVTIKNPKREDAWRRYLAITGKKDDSK